MDYAISGCYVIAPVYNKYSAIIKNKNIEQVQASGCRDFI